MYTPVSPVGVPYAATVIVSDAAVLVEEPGKGVLVTYPHRAAWSGYRAWEGISGVTAWVRCLAGSVMLTPGGSCTQCPAGSFSGALGATTCTLCPAGTYSGTVGATSAAACLPCPAGTVSTVAGSATCSVCPAATPYSTVNSTECRDCSAGCDSMFGLYMCPTLDWRFVFDATGVELVNRCVVRVAGRGVVWGQAMGLPDVVVPAPSV